jgi:hypothetical protein
MRRLLERGAEHKHLVGRLARRNLDGKKPRVQTSTIDVQ